ncbi:MAG TPA: hypothetical protein VFD88_04575 [Clostridia bacterium]|nr:hypothetical protein [Clostridia bacterium]
MGARVAMLRLTEGPPHVLLTDHLEGDGAILIYRVANLKEALADLKARGWKKAQTLEIPMGPRLLLHRAGRPPGRRLRAVATGGSRALSRPA